MSSIFGYRGIPEGMRERVPAGQYVTPKMPVMTLGSMPRLSTADWKLRVTGLVEREVELDWDAFLALAGVVGLRFGQ